MLPTVPPSGMPDDVDFVECRNTGEVAERVRREPGDDFDVVVVDTSPAEQLGYDPVDAVRVLAARPESRPPRYLVAVVMRGLTADYHDAPLAFAVEIRDLWPRNQVTLAVEEAALYYLENSNYAGKPPNAETDGDFKGQAISQQPRWGGIAARAVRMARGEIIPDVPVIPSMTRTLVTAVCAGRKEGGAPYLSSLQRDILFHLARRQRRSPREIANALVIDENYVRRLQAGIVTTLSPAVDPPARGGPSTNGAFCEELVNRYGSWLISRSVRTSREADATARVTAAPVPRSPSTVSRPAPCLFRAREPLASRRSVRLRKHARRYEYELPGRRHGHLRGRRPRLRR